jgi:hypothetical protein
MSKDSGFIKIHRSIVDWEWYTDTKTLALFIHLLLTVEYKEKKYKGYKIPKGSRVCSYASLAEESGLSVQSVRTAINHLKSTGEVTISKTPHFSIISIENWGKYQDRQQGSQQGANKALTGHQQHPKNNIRNKEYSLDTLKGVSKESEKHEKAVSQYADWNDAWD